MVLKWIYSLFGTWIIVDNDFRTQRSSLWEEVRAVSREYMHPQVPRVALEGVLPPGQFQDLVSSGESGILKIEIGGKSTAQSCPAVEEEVQRVVWDESEDPGWDTVRTIALRKGCTVCVLVKNKHDRLGLYHFVSKQDVAERPLVVARAQLRFSQLKILVAQACRRPLAIARSVRLDNRLPPRTYELDPLTQLAQELEADPTLGHDPWTRLQQAGAASFASCVARGNFDSKILEP
ncbi:hypothetical protein GNI_014600 [Gregarina niphandrodes]|uniref:Uncharacterized protein n=1 Tax=Gregarina niphandrodes TaxID=110365 RepID=A0A023BCC5_GRENI|nr:hypothetical protein GNI_014600 [Gregarina niphandrodes]EZG83570.1 hypothetical protein GNI_014600 [Gregarina niphandrodes]|eukprot:XP_011128931.1 hypothetical protein GNI_014600 [Gregarina niphandrodes]